MMGTSISPLFFKKNSLFATISLTPPKMPSSPSPHPFPPTLHHSLSLLTSYTRSRSLPAAKRLHALLLTSGHLLSPLLLSKLSSLYSLCGNHPLALHLLDQIPHPLPSLYSSLIRGHATTHHPLPALRLFSRMLASGCPPDHFSLPFAIKACRDLSLLRAGSQLHSLAVASGLASNVFVQNNLVAFYMTCGRPEPAAAVFNTMGKQRSVVSWNSMIKGLVQNGRAEEALNVFDRMTDEGSEVDAATVVCVLPACAQTGDLRRGEKVRQLADEKGFAGDVIVRNALVYMYAKCGRVEEARRVFDDGRCERNVITWTAMIGGYAMNGCFAEVLALAYQMLLEGVRPNAVTMASLLSACCSIDHGKCIHGACIRLFLCGDIVVETALIDMYAKCGSTASGLLMFSRGSRRTSTWNVIISSNAQIGRVQEAIEHFKLMLAERIVPDFATFASLLPAYGDLGNLMQIENIHSYLVRMGYLRNITATTGLIDAYAKVGYMVSARKLFEGLPVKDLMSWTTIIVGYGKNGDGEAAIELFRQMELLEVEPNEVTFTCMLYTCSHTGLVDMGLKIFDRMRESCHSKLNVDHYACIIDLLGRAGRLEEAHKLIRTMPFEANHAVWGALLGACAKYENVELGEMAAKHLFVIEPENTGNYVLLRNIYATAGRWEEAESVHRMLVERRLMKSPGSSLIEARNM